MKFQARYDNSSYELADFMEKHLDGGSYETGKMETIEYTQTNLIAAFSELLNILLTKKIISKEDIYKMVGQKEKGT